MRTAMWLALAYLAINHLMYPSIAKGATVGLVFAFMIISREEVINGWASCTPANGGARNTV